MKRRRVDSIFIDTMTLTTFALGLKKWGLGGNDGQDMVRNHEQVYEIVTGHRIVGPTRTKQGNKCRCDSRWWEAPSCEESEGTKLIPQVMG